MPHNTDLLFLREKVNDLKSALLFSENTSLLKIFTTIVHVLEVDERGQLWFFVPRPTQELREFDREFPARLEFFRKGKLFYLHITGRAYIITDPVVVNAVVHEHVLENVQDKMVLIKVRISKACYYDMGTTSRAGSWSDLWYKGGQYCLNFAIYCLKLVSIPIRYKTTFGE